MSKEIVIRFSSSAGRSRFSLLPTATLSELQAKVTTATGVDASSQRLAFDNKGARPVGGSASSSLSSLGFVNGTELHLMGADATMAGQVLTKEKVAVATEKLVPAAPGAATPGASSTAAPAPATSGGASGSGSAGDTSAGPKWSDNVVDTSKWSDKADRKAKFEVFDTFLRTRQYQTGNLQGSHKHSTIMIKAGGGAIKIPPSVSIKQQPYRHVDQLSIYNVDEIQNFMSYWRYDLLPEATQRIGWMYGYYLADGNYGDKDHCEGTRVVIEGIYEPPQQMIGGECVLQADPDLATVNRIAEALGIECVGQIFTSFALDSDLLLSPKETLNMGRLQNEHSTDIHFTKYRLSKFVSCAVRPDPNNNGDPALNPYMVSDQCQALLRDGMLQDEVGQTDVIVRAGTKGECMPTFLVEGKDNRNIPTDFFVIPMVESMPKKVISLFTHADFPRENRPRQLQQRDDLKKYFKKRSSSEPSWSRFADFHLLLFVAKALDVDTAMQLCESIRERQEISEGTKMLFESLIG